MLRRIVLSVVVGVVVTLACILVGLLLQVVGVEPAVVVGRFLQGYAGLLGLLAAIWFFLTGHLQG